MERHRVVVLGAGYAGLPAAQRLAPQGNRLGVQVTVLNASDRFVERPRLHQMATAQPVADAPLADLLAGTGADLVVGRVDAIDLDRRALRVVVADGRTHTVGYDTLIYAAGSTIDVDRVPGVRDHAHTLADPASAVRIATVASTVAAEGGTAVVCGGGLTGLEAATEIAEAHPGLTVRLVSTDTPGAWLSARARRHLDRALDRLGVVVAAGATVAEVRPDGVLLADGRWVATRLCVWAGGFSVPTLAAEAGLAVDTAGRALVDPTLRSVSHPEVLVIGDAAAVSGPWGPTTAYGCGPGGLMALYVARTLADRLAGREPEPFRFPYVHQTLSLGRHDAVVQFVRPRDNSPLPRAVLTGRLAVWYKETVLTAALWVLRHPGLFRPRRRPTAPGTGAPHRVGRFGEPGRRSEPETTVPSHVR